MCISYRVITFFLEYTHEDKQDYTTVQILHATSE